MPCKHLFYTILLICFAFLHTAQPIKVSFGTNEGPIVPRQIIRQPKSTTSEEKVLRNPAPVSEERIDVPNPNIYRPPFPHQYREKLLNFKTFSNLIFGTPLDQKYTPRIPKYHYYKKQLQKVGVNYTGPNTFEKQEYEFLPKTVLSPSVRYSKAIYVPVSQNGNSKYVPEIGVLYSSGVRYYSPQIVVFNHGQQPIPNPKYENSVFGLEDVKYYQ